MLTHERFEPGTIVAVTELIGAVWAGVVTADTDAETLVIRTTGRGRVRIPWSEVEHIEAVPL